MTKSDISLATALRMLAKDYYQNHIQMPEYRMQRKIILDKIDIEFNARKVAKVEQNDTSFMGTLAFNINDIPK